MKLLSSLTLLGLLLPANLGGGISAQEKQAPPRPGKLVARWIQLLEKGNASDRRRAALILGDAPRVEAAVPALARALQDPDDAVRALAAIALGRMGPDAKQAVPALLRALQDKEAAVRIEAAGALGRIGDDPKTSVAALSEALKDRDEDVRSTAAWSLGAFGADAKAAVPALLESLKRGTGLVRANAAQALLRIEQHKSGIAGLLDALKDEDSFVRSFAAEAFAQNVPLITGPEVKLVIAALTEALKDNYPHTRGLAATALAEFGPAAKPAFGALLEIYKKGGLHQPFVAAVLRRIDPEAAMKEGIK